MANNPFSQVNIARHIIKDKVINLATVSSALIQDIMISAKYL